MSETFDPYYKWLGILPRDQPPHHYRLLGLEPFEEDLQVIEAAADRQLGFLRRYQTGTYSAECKQLLNEVSRARLCLLKDATKKAYDAQLRQRQDAASSLKSDALETAAKTGSRPTVGITPQGLKNKKHVVLAAGIGAALLLLIVVGLTQFFGKPAAPVVAQGAPGEADPDKAGKTASGEKADASETAKKVTVTPVRKTSPQRDVDPYATANLRDLLPLLKPEHIVAGNWKIEPGRLEAAGHTQYGRIVLPANPPEEYTLHIRGTRMETPGAPTTAIGLMLVCGGYRTLFQMDVLPDKGTSGLHLLDSRIWNLNPTFVPAFQTQIGKPFNLDAIVRKNAIEIRVDGRTIVDWQGNSWQLSLGDGWANSPDKKLLLASEVNCVFTQIAIGSPLPRNELPGSDLKPGETVDLLPLVDLKRDVWKGTVVREGTSLKTDNGPTCQFSVPFAVPDEYLLTADVETTLPAREFYLGAPVQSGYLGTSLACEGGYSNFLAIDGIVPQYLTDRFVKEQMQTTPRSKLSLEVRNSHIILKVADKKVFDWKGDPRRFISECVWMKPGRQITFGTNRFPYRFHSLTLKRLPASPSPFAPPALPQNGDLLAIVDLDRDTMSGLWAKLNDTTLLSWMDKLAAIRFPAKLPHNYEFRMLVERKGTSHPFSIHLPINNKSVMVTIDGDELTTAGIEFFGGVRFNSNNTTQRYSEPKFVTKVPQVIQGRIQDGHLRLDIDGKKLLDLAVPPYIPDPSWLQRPGWLNPEERLQLAITTHASFEIREVRFRGLEAGSPEFPPLDLVALRSAAPGAPKGNGPSTASVAPTGLPVPSAAALETAEKKIRQAMPDEFKKKKDNEKQALAAKLENLAADTPDDPAVKYVCFDLARNLSIEAGDVTHALSLVEVLDALFQVDAVELKAATVKALAPQVKGPLLNKELLDVSMPLVDELIAAEKYQLAANVSALALQFSIKVKDKIIQAQAAELKRETQESLKEFEVADAGRKALEAKPDDADAKILWGRWLCLHKGNWPEGLKLLAASSHPQLKALAERDLKSPIENAAMLELGTAWIAFAKAQMDASESQFAERALFWLQKVVDQSSGVARTRAEEQVADAIAVLYRDSPLLKLVEQIEKKVTAKRYTRQPETSHAGGTQFDSISDPPGILIGFNCKVADYDYSTIVQGLQPVYFTKFGPRTGPWQGSSEGGRLMEVRARPGYACNGLSSQVRESFDNTQMSFAKVTRTGLDPQRVYLSPLIGLDPRHSAAPFISTTGTQPIVGIYGHADKNLKGLGIISTNK